MVSAPFVEMPMSVAAEHTQSLTEFRDAVGDTLDRVNRAGEAEAIVIDGQVRGFLVPPAVYDEMAREAQLSRDVAGMRRALQEHAEGKSRPAEEFFDELRAKLLAMKAAQQLGAPR